MQLNRNLILPSVVTIALILALSPYAFSIDFMQNDDWVHYKTLENFLAGNYKLDDYLGSTFYTMGFMSLYFAKVFGLNSLPILTFIVSIINFVLINIILVNYREIEIKMSLALSLLWYFNPITFYSSFGFMIEHYFIFYMLLSFIFICKFLKHNSYKYLILSNVFLILGFFVKHFMVFIMVAFIYKLFDKTRHNLTKLTIYHTSNFYFAIEIVITLGVILYYFISFPRNTILQNQSFDYINILNIKYLVMIGLYICALFPAEVVSIILRMRNVMQIKYIFVSALAFYILFYVVDLSLKFPYFQNVFTRKGFYPSDLFGEKYSFYGNYKFFELWQIAGLLILVFFFSLLTSLYRSNKYKISDFYVICTIFFCIFLVFRTPLYDRYLTVLFTIFIIWISKYSSLYNSRLLSLLRFGILSMLIVIDLFYINDYIWWQTTINQETWVLRRESGIKSADIASSRAINKYNNVNILDKEDNKSKNKMMFFFTFNSSDKFDIPGYALYKTIKRQSRITIFRDEAIYIYKKI